MNDQNSDWTRNKSGNWTRILAGHRLTVCRYRAFNGRKIAFSYVPRVDGSAPTSPAIAFLSLKKAKLEAEWFAKQIAEREKSKSKS